LPESTRWLTVKKRYPEAKEIYEKAAKLNKKEIPPHLLVIPADAPTKAIEAGEAEGAPSAVASHDSNPIGSASKVLKTMCLLVF
jgi:OCT family organic cation transporter-like MFS transporter 4/5